MRRFVAGVVVGLLVAEPVWWAVGRALTTDVGWRLLGRRL